LAFASRSRFRGAEERSAVAFEQCHDDGDEGVWARGGGGLSGVGLEQRGGDA
jgi:hypothetical protein